MFHVTRALASGSDDCHIILWAPLEHRKLTSFRTLHSGNVFSVKVSDGVVLLSNNDYTYLVSHCNEYIILLLQLLVILYQPAALVMVFNNCSEKLLIQYLVFLKHCLLFS